MDSLHPNKFRRSSFALFFFLGAAVLFTVILLVHSCNSAGADEKEEHVQITIPYMEGGEMKTQVTRPAELFFSRQKGVRHVHSRTTTGMCELTITMANDSEVSQLLQKGTPSLEALKKQLPVRAAITETAADSLAPFVFALQGETDPMNLSRVANKLRDTLNRIQFVQEVRVKGELREVCMVTPDQKKMDAVYCTSEQLRSTLWTFALLSRQGGPAGIDDIRNAEAVRNGNVSVTVGEIATVEQRTELSGSSCSYNGNPAILIAIFPRPGTNASFFADAINQQISSFRKKIPSGIELHRVIHWKPPVEKKSLFWMWVIMLALLVMILVLLVLTRNNKSGRWITLPFLFIAFGLAALQVWWNKPERSVPFLVLRYSTWCNADSSAAKIRSAFAEKLKELPGVESFTQEQTVLSGFLPGRIQGECILVPSSGLAANELAMQLRQKEAMLPGIKTEVWSAGQDNSSFAPLGEPPLTIELKSRVESTLPATVQSVMTVLEKENIYWMSRGNDYEPSFHILVDNTLPQPTMQSQEEMIAAEIRQLNTGEMDGIFLGPPDHPVQVKWNYFPGEAPKNINELWKFIQNEDPDRKDLIRMREETALTECLRDDQQNAVYFYVWPDANTPQLLQRLQSQLQSVPVADQQELVIRKPKSPEADKPYRLLLLNALLGALLVAIVGFFAKRKTT